jgi:hypothetical protein
LAARFFCGNLCGMKTLVLALGLLVLNLPTFAQSAKETTLQFQRTDQLIGRLEEQNKQFLQDIRTLQRENARLTQLIESAAIKADRTADQLQQLENVKLNNLAAGQQQIMGKLTDDNVRMDWGSGTRDCPELGNKHQQIKTVTKPDGTRTVRFLCFDGRALHLGTEVHSPAE